MALVQLRTYGLEMVLRAHFIGKTTPKHLHTSMRQLYREELIFDGPEANMTPGIKGGIACSFSAQLNTGSRRRQEKWGVTAAGIIAQHIWLRHAMHPSTILLHKPDRHQ
jgi:hypothetical protein